jgi:hypothetical protein
MSENGRVVAGELHGMSESAFKLSVCIAAKENRRTFENVIALYL